MGLATLPLPNAVAVYMWTLASTPPMGLYAMYEESLKRKKARESVTVNEATLGNVSPKSTCHTGDSGVSVRFLRRWTKNIYKRSIVKYDERTQSKFPTRPTADIPFTG